MSNHWLCVEGGKHTKGRIYVEHRYFKCHDGSSMLIDMQCGSIFSIHSMFGSDTNFYKFVSITLKAVEYEIHEPSTYRVEFKEE